MKLLDDGDLPRAVLLLGGPGVGKTTLSLAAAAHPRLADRYGTRRWCVYLHTATSAVGLHSALIQSIGLDPTKDRLETALTRLSEAPSLLVLDDLQTPWEADPVSVEATLAQLASVADLALIVSIRGEDSVLGVNWALRKSVQPLGQDASKELFLKIAPSMLPKTGEEELTLDYLLAELGGVPLAIALVAQRAASRQSVTEVAAAWKRLGVSVSQRSGVEPSRWTSLEKSIQLSLDSCRLNAPGLKLFQILGQLPSGLSRTELLKLLAPEDGFQAVTELLSVGLAVEKEKENRIDLLPPIREYARRHKPPPEEEADRLRRYYLDLAKKWGNQIGTEAGANAERLLTPELANIEAALEHAVRSGEIAEARLSATAIHRLMTFTGRGDPSVFSRIADECAKIGDHEGEAALRWHFAAISSARASYAVALPSHYRALRLYRMLDNKHGEMKCLLGLGDIERAHSNYDAAWKLYSRALKGYRSIYERTGIKNGVGEAHCWERLGDIEQRRYRADEAEWSYLHALQEYSDLRDILGEANCEIRLGELARRRLDYESAQKHFLAAFGRYRQAGDLRGQAGCVLGQADIARRQLELTLAWRGYEKASCILETVGAQSERIKCFLGLAKIDLQRNRHNDAKAYLTTALMLSERLGNTRAQAEVYKDFGDLNVCLADFKAARLNFETAHEFYTRARSKRGQAFSIRGYGDIARCEADVANAREHYWQALRLFTETGDKYGIALMHDRLSSVTKAEECKTHVKAAREIWDSVVHTKSDDIVGLFAESANAAGVETGANLIGVDI